MSDSSVIEMKAQPSALQPVTRQDVEALKAQRELLKDFIGSQLREAKFPKGGENDPGYGEGDYGVIPGTKKFCLFKQGAEKALKLFSLGVRFTQTDKELDRHANFALYTYKAEVYVLRTGVVLADCEGTANSQEVKYRERTTWKKNANGVRESSKEETPIYDVINTLQKMAQKRALIGATLLATGLSEYFTQDGLEPDGELDPPAAPPAGEKAAPKDVQSEVALSAPPVCCGKPMMLSKYADRETGKVPFYCISCKAKVPA